MSATEVVRLHFQVHSCKRQANYVPVFHPFEPQPFKPFLLLVFTPVFRGVPPLQDTITLSSSKFPRIPRVSLKIRKPWVKFPKDVYPWTGQALAE